MSDDRPSEKCPVCGAPHVVPPLQVRKSASFYPLVSCDCGALLETTMPVFKETDSGFVFRNIKKTDE